MSSSVGSTQATVRPGETAQATIQLRGGPVIAKAFVIHFARDSAFIEPPMRPVLRQVAEYAATHPKEKLLIVGHTDLTGSAEYNQSLSERRARSAYAFVTCRGRLEDWEFLRLKRKRGELPSTHDSWGVREYQFMLQDLEYYPGNVTGEHDTMTNSAVCAFQRKFHKPEDGLVNSSTWNTLILEYMTKDVDAENFDLLHVPSNAFFSRGGEVLKWLGCGELDPVENRSDAWRPNRRTEFLFVNVQDFLFDVAKPDTFDLPKPGVVGTSWKFGPRDCKRRCGFATRGTAENGKWLIQPVEAGATSIQGSIALPNGHPLGNCKYELSAPDGEYMDGENSNNGLPILARTTSDGTFEYPDKVKGVGVYTFTIHGPYAIALEEPCDSPENNARRSYVWHKTETTLAANHEQVSGTSYGASPHGNESVHPQPIQLSIVAYPGPLMIEIVFLKQVVIAGIANEQLKYPLRTNQLTSNQEDALFEIEARAPGCEDNALELVLSTYSPIDSSTCLDTIRVALARCEDDRFKSRPILAIPYAIRQGHGGRLNTVDLDVIYALAGGTIQASLWDQTGYIAKETVGGKILNVFSQGFTSGNEPGEADTMKIFILKSLSKANVILAQAGIEVKERSLPTVSVHTGSTFSSLQIKKQSQANHQRPDEIVLNGGLLTEECATLLGISCENPSSSPPSSKMPRDVNVYYIEQILDIDENGERSCIGRIMDPFQRGLDAPFNPDFQNQAIIIAAEEHTEEYYRTLAHELGHLLSLGHCKDEWRSNIMRERGGGDELSPEQLAPVELNISLGWVRCLVPEPPTLNHDKQDVAQGLHYEA